MTAVTPSARQRLAEACEPIAADGTDPELLSRVIGWGVRPRRSLDALRRACRDAPRPPGSAGSTGSAGSAGSTGFAGSAGSTGSAGPDGLSAVIGGAVTEADAVGAQRLVDAWAELGVRIALVGDPAYPERLAEGWPHTDGPVLLAWRGSTPEDRPAVALVGQRRATSYGVGVTAWLAQAAAGAGIRVVSGGAVGVDAAAHEAALDEPGGTSVVLGCGHAIAYPRAHARPGGLFDRIVAGGGTIVGELLPYEPPRAGQVRARNRIVAALADVVVVVEGGERSGALLTAGAAAERGRTLLAVPGDVRAPGSAAPHRLLAEGAGPCTGPTDLLAAFGRVAQEAHPGAGAQDGGLLTHASTLPPEVHRVLAEAWPRAVRLDRLAAAVDRPIPALLAAVTRARVAGEVVEAADGLRLRQAPR